MQNTDEFEKKRTQKKGKLGIIKKLAFFGRKNSEKNLVWYIEATSLLLLQLVSLATTLDGSKLLFGDEKMPFIKTFSLAYVLGFGIQLLLIGILVFNAFEKIPVRRLMAIILLTFFSIYTNFFSIYNTRNGGLLEKNVSIDQAQSKYNNLVTYLYTNPKAKLDGLEREAAILRCSLYQEDPEGTPQPDASCPNLGFNQGKGEKYKDYRTKLDIVNEQLRVLDKNYLNNVAPKYFDENIVKNLQSKDARAIYELSQEALKSVPFTIKEEATKQGYKPTEYDDIKDFFPEEGSSYFLIPAQKVFTEKQNRETEAVVAFVVATAIDVVSLMLGANLHGFYSSLKKSLFGINPIADIFNGLFFYLEDIGKSIVPFIEAPVAYSGEIWLSLIKGCSFFITSILGGIGILITSIFKGIIEIFAYPGNNIKNQSVRNKLFLEDKNGSGVEFLDTFYNAINKVNISILEDDVKNFQLYQTLISDMQTKRYFEETNGGRTEHYEHNSAIPNRFQGNNQQKLILKPERKRDFSDWYIKQRNLQIERERNGSVNKISSRNLLDFPPD